MNHTDIHKKLPNGISLVLVPLANTAAVTSIVLMGVGSRHESDEQRGLAHFAEHMVFKGGRKYTTAQDVAQALDAVGGEFNAFTSLEFTGFYTKTAAQHMELGVDVLSDMVLHATFPKEDLEREKGVIVEEMNMYEDMPMRKVDTVLFRLIYGDTPLGRETLGTKESVTSFTQKDFLDYRQEFYFGSKCTIVLAGAIDPEMATTLVENYFGEMPSGETAKSLIPAVLADTGRLLIEEKASEQTHLMLGVMGYPLGSPHRYAYRVLATILGGNMSSRLFTSVRERQGLCYYVRASPDTYTDTGILVASAGVDNTRLALAVAAIIKEFRLMRDEPVSQDELSRAKQFLLGKTLLAMEDSEQVAEFYGMQQLLEGKTEDLEKIEEQIQSVTAEEIQAIAQELFVDEGLRLAIIGPQKDREGLEKLLTFSTT